MRILPWCSAFVLAASVVLGAEETLPKRIFDETPAAREAQMGEQRNDLGGLILPVVKPDIEVPVVELWLKERKSE